MTGDVYIVSSSWPKGRRWPPQDRARLTCWLRAASTNLDTLDLAASATCWLLRSKSVPVMKRVRLSSDTCNAAELPAPSTEYWAHDTAWEQLIWFTQENLDRWSR